MTLPPPQPKIYHITHMSNLHRIIASGGLVSDAIVRAQGGPEIAIGMSDIKRRRMDELPVHCHPGTMVGDYVPFYFCPRSIMLYVIHCANKPELSYRGGQTPIVHLEADLMQVIRLADKNDRQWAFSLANAGTRYVRFRNQIAELSELNWTAIAAADFRPADVREGKQAEFLVYGFFPWTLVERIGVYSRSIAQRVHDTLRDAPYRPSVEIKSSWYF
jgi:hypothetical protein